jgi:sortase (surface protein transpeptidase)
MSRQRVLIICLVLVAVLAAAGLGIWQVRRVIGEARAQLAAAQRELRADPESESGSQSSESATTESTTPPSASTQIPASGRQPIAAVQRACSQMDELERSLGPTLGLSSVADPVAQLVSHLPRVGQQSAGTLSLASAAGETYAALHQACDALDPVLRSEGQDVASLVAALAPARDELRAASARLSAAESKLETIDTGSLDDTARGLAVTLRERVPGLRARIALLAELPGLLGQDGPRSYLILGQNRDELRPTGGFIGTSGIVTFDRGRLVRREYGSSYDLRLPPNLLVPPPAGLTRYMGAGYWHLYESNWWPDFPASARQARYFYNILRTDEIAGVLAIDQEFIAMLLDVTGPIEVAEYGEMVTRENLHERLEHYVHDLPSPNEQSRKGFITALFGMLAERLEQLPSERSADLAQVLEWAFLGQNAQVWLADERAQQAVASVGWDGRMLSTGGDYLFAVSANVSGNSFGGFKINRLVKQALAYDVTEDADGRLVGHATLTLRNGGMPDLGARRPDVYRNYFRLYVPEGSELLSAAGFESGAEAFAECGRMAIGGLLVVGPGQERTLSLVYRLPPSITIESYTLLVQRQAGTPPLPLQLGRSGTFDGALTASVTSPQAFRVDGGHLVPDRWTPSIQPVPSASACQIHSEAPKVLARPSTLSIPRLGVSAPVADLGVDANGTLQAPENGDVIGWYAQTARPGQVGNVIASGHVDWNKKLAVFSGLDRLVSGDEIDITAQDGSRYRYAVDWVKSVDAYTAPLAEILGPTSERWLTLITCGGTFDPLTRDFSHRVVVRARLVGSGEP